MSPARRSALTAFLLGLIVGAAGGSWGQRALFHRFMRRGPSPARIIERLNRALSLDAGQKTEVGRILESRKPELEALKKDAKTRFDAIRTATDADIREVLRPDQREKFDRLTARWRERMRSREAAGGPGPG
jgi:hypothetical protein